MRKESKTAATRLLSGKAFALLLVVAAAFGLVLSFSQPAYADTVLAFTSDIHNASGNTSANRLGSWLGKMKGKYGPIDVFASGGDMGSASVYGDSFWTLAEADMTAVNGAGVTGIYTTGNHEYMNGSYGSTSNSLKQRFVEDQAVRDTDTYHMYALGTSSSNSSSGGSGWGSTVWNVYDSDQISALKTYLRGINDSKPIFIITHYPLHWVSDRNITGSNDVIDLLNDASNGNLDGVKRKIVFLWGHNHTNANRNEKNYDEIFAPGESITTDTSRKLEFYYAAAGCMSDSDYGEGSGAVKGKGLIVSIDGDGMLTFAFYNASGTNVTEDGTNGQGTSYFEKGYGEEPAGSGDDEPQVGDTVSITPSTSNPEESIKIAVGDTLTINVTNGSANDQTYDFTASLSKSGIAEITSASTITLAAGETGQITVKGLANGTVDITVQNQNSYGSQYVRKGTVHLTVGEGGSGGDEPQTGDSVSITPSTDNPEQSIKIAVGDTLTISVTNGSSNSAYNYTATLSKSGIAEITSAETINIAAGGTGQFTVKGLAEGTVDINIQNDQSYSQYARKGVIHLTVGEGGSGGDEPQTGDSVSITPTTDNPEESIKISVGDTLTINVTNSSTRSAYNYTATLSNSGIAEITSASTVNIAAGATGQFTVKGLKAGTVDINIQNDQTYSGYERTGVIHLTVVEAGASVAVTGVTVSPTSASIDTGKTTQLTATVQPTNATNKTVTWSSSDPSVATVDSNGKVTGVSAGTATITATTEDGGKIATSTITVVAPEPGTTVTYELVDKIEAGKDYLIATGKSGSVYLLSGEAGSSSDSLKGYSATAADNKITIDTATEAKTLYTAEAGKDDDSFRLTIGGKYLYANNSGALRLESSSIWSQSSGGGSSNSGKYWHYKGADKYLLWFFLDSEDNSGSNGYNYAGSTYRYYVDYDGSNFSKGTLTSSSTSLANTNTPKIYVYSKVDTPAVTLDRLEVISAPNEFTVGDTFTSEGIQVAAYYSDGAVVEAHDCDIDSSKVDMTTPGTYPVTVSFTSDGETVSTTYEVTVKAAPVTETNWVRLAGDDRYDTMADIVQEGFASASEAIVCNGKNFPDALMASSLAGALDGDVPVVLTKPTELVKQAADELERLGVTKVYILGGEAVVSADVVSAIESMGIATERISGNNRQATGIAVMQKIDQLGGYDGTVVVATGKKTYAASDTKKKNERGFADALSIGPWCYKSGTPILLTKNDLTLSEDQVAAAKKLGVKRLIIVGGESAVSNEVVTQLGIDPDAVERLGGENRYETSQIIADWEMAHDMTMTNVSVATGANFPDALAGAPLCGKNNSVLLLALDNKDDNMVAVNTFVKKGAGIETGYVLGGEAAVSADLFSYLESLTA